MRLLPTALALSLLLLPACHRPGPPSPAYAHARAQFNALYADALDDAYLDPQMADVEAELRSVPRESVDHPEAEALLARIAQGRQAAQKEKDRLQQAVDEALAPPEMTGGVEVEAGAPDAGAGASAAAYPTAGMSLADFQKAFGDCFHRTGEARVGDAGTPAALYALVDAPDCQRRYPYFQSRLVVADGSKVIGKALKSAYRPPPDAGKPAPAVDAGAPIGDAGAAPAR